MKINILLLACTSLLVLTGCDKQQEVAGKDFAASLSAAQNQYDSGQYQAARAEITTAIKANPKSNEAHFLAGKVYEKLGDFQSALKEYISADSEPSRLAAAALLIQAQAYNQADVWIARDLAERPGDKSMKSYRALLNQRLGNNRAARMDAEEVLTANSRNVVANAVVAQESLGKKDTTKALNNIEAGLLTDPADKTLLQLKADVFLQQGDVGKAIEIYRTLVQANPNASKYYSNLAELVARKSGVDEGEQVFRHGLELAPENTDLHMQLVAFTARHRDKAAVINQLRSEIAAAPEKTLYDIVLADVYNGDGKFEVGVQVLKNAIARTESEPAHTAAQLALARLLLARGDTESARTTLESVLKRNPTDDEALAVRGQLTLADRRPAEAIQQFLSIAGRQPANPKVFFLLADAYLQNNQPKEAITALRRVASLRPSDFEPIRRIEEIQTGFGDFQEARRTIEDFNLRNPDSFAGQVAQLQILIKKREWATADAVLARLHSTPGSDQIAVAYDAEVKEGEGLYSDAAELYRKRLLRKSDARLDTAAAQGFARVSIALGQSSASLDLLNKLSPNVASEDLSSYDLVLSTLHDSLGDQEQASALVQSAMQVASSNPAPYLQQATTFARENKGGKALEILDRGIAAGAPSEPLLFARAEVQKLEGNYGDAILSYRKILAADPKSALAANEIVNLLADQKPLDKEGLRSALEVLERNSPIKNQSVLDTIAWSNYRLGQFEKARDLLIIANADRSTKPQLRFHYGAVLIALGENAKGKELIKNTLNDNYRERDEAEDILRISG